MTDAQPPDTAVTPLPPLPTALGPAAIAGTLIAQWDGTGTAPANSNVSLPVGDQGAVFCQITGTWAATLSFEGSVDNVKFDPLHVNALATDTLVTTTTGGGIFALPAGLTAVRVRCSAYTSGTATVTLRATPGTSAVLSVSAAGWGTGGGGGGGGAVTIADGAAVTLGAQADAAAVADNSTATLMSLFKRLLARLTTLLPQNAGRLNVDGTGGAFPVSGTVTANAGTGTLATSVADGQNVTIGTTTNAAITSDTGGSVISYLRGVAKVIASVWDSGNSGIRALIINNIGVSSLPALPAGTNAIGNVGGFSSAPLVTLTRGADTTTYAAQDEVATTGTAPVSFSVSRSAGLTGIITGADLIYSNNPATTPGFRLLLFSATVTAAGDNAPLALSDAHAALFIGMIDFSSTQAGGSGTGTNLMMSGAAVNAKPFTTDTVFGLLITTNGWTPIANSETIKLRLNLETN